MEEVVQIAGAEEVVVVVAININKFKLFVSHTFLIKKVWDFI